MDRWTVNVDVNLGTYLAYKGYIIGSVYRTENAEEMARILNEHETFVPVEALDGQPT